MDGRRLACGNSARAALLVLATLVSGCSLLVPVSGLSGGESDGGAGESPSGSASPLPGVVLGDAATAPGSGGGDASTSGTGGVHDSGGGGAPVTSVDGGAVDASKDATPLVDSAPPTCVGDKARIFVTSTLYGAAFNGVAGADEDCATRAQALGGTWRAWLSDSNTSAGNHVRSSATSYVLLDGTVVASSFSGLVSGSLAHDIDETELKSAPPDGNTEVWTGIDVSGAMGNAGFCTDTSGNDWASDDPSAATPLVGHLNASDSTWSAAYLQVCNRTNVRLYCVEFCP